MENSIINIDEKTNELFINKRKHRKHNYAG